MTVPEASKAVLNLLNDLIGGSAPEGSWILNPNDPGLLRSLDALPAEQASEIPSGGGSSIAAHVEHLRFGLELLNRWGEGETDVFVNANFSASWAHNIVTTEEWAVRRKALARETHKWCRVVENPTASGGPGIDAMIASVVHLAYHLGAIRQIDRSLRGPSAND